MSCSDLCLDLCTGGTVDIWSAPRSRLNLPPGSVEVCVDDICDAIDTHHLYLSVPIPRLSLASSNSNASVLDASRTSTTENQPVLLWSTSGLDYKRTHHVAVKLIERNPVLGPHPGHGLKALTLDHISYTKFIDPPPPPPPPPPPVRPTTPRKKQLCSARVSLTTDDGTCDQQRRPPRFHHRCDDDEGVCVGGRGGEYSHGGKYSGGWSGQGGCARGVRSEGIPVLRARINRLWWAM